MTGLRLWLRRSSGLVALPALVVVTFAVVLSRSGWHLEWDWALSWTSSSTIVLAPLVAGLTAFEVDRRTRPTLLTLSATARRGSWTVLTVAAAMWVFATTAWATGTAYGAVRAAIAGAGGLPSPWVLVQAPAALLAATLFGAMVGVLVRNVGAGPLAAVTAYLLPIVAVPFGISGLLAAGGATGSLLGVEPDPAVATAVLATNLSFGLVCAGVVLVRTLPRDRVRQAGTAVAAVALVGSAVTLASLDPMISSYRPRAAEPLCVGEAPKVCGPVEGAAVLRTVQDDLARVRGVVSQHGLELPARYDLAVAGMEPTPEAGLVGVDATQMAAGRVATWDLAVAVATPAACPAYFGDLPPEDLLEVQRQLAEAIEPALDGSGPVAMPDEQLRSAHAALRACDAEAAADVRRAG